MPTRLPLTALRAFEAAARYGSLTAAASELGVTRPAISKQIKQLEQMLNCTLMNRLGNAVQLTPAGQDLAHDVALAFGQIAASLERQLQGRTLPNVIRILVDRDFASSFLAGHIGQFLLHNPGVSVEVVAEKNGRMRLDEDFNFRIFYGHFGATPCPGLRERVLCRWYDLVVCTPDYAQSHVSDSGALVDAQLLIDGNYNVSPRVSFDGKLLAFITRNAGRFQVAVQDLATRQTTILTDSARDESPSFAPNGRMILYATDSGGRGVLSAVSTDGRIRQRLTVQAADVREPAWGPQIR